MSESSADKYRANYDKAFPRRRPVPGRTKHADGTPISFDYKKIAACRHAEGRTEDHGDAETCAECGLIVACAPSKMEPQLRQISGANFMEMMRQTRG